MLEKYAKVLKYSYVHPLFRVNTFKKYREDLDLS